MQTMKGESTCGRIQGVKSYINWTSWIIYKCVSSSGTFYKTTLHDKPFKNDVKLSLSYQKTTWFNLFLCVTKIKDNSHGSFCPKQYSRIRIFRHPLFCSFVFCQNYARILKRFSPENFHHSFSFFFKCDDKTGSYKSTFASFSFVTLYKKF